MMKRILQILRACMLHCTKSGLELTLIHDNGVVKYDYIYLDNVNR